MTRVLAFLVTQKLDLKWTSDISKDTIVNPCVVRRTINVLTKAQSETAEYCKR